MGKFVDKNALFDIIMEVRDGSISKQSGLKKIFSLLLSLNGRVGVIDGEVVFNPNKYAYLDYVDTYSSIIKMQEGTGTTLTRSLKLAILEEEQEWEIRVGEQICSQINESLKKCVLEDRMLYLDQFINGLTITEICTKYNLSRTLVYDRTKKIKAFLYNGFNFYLRDMDELMLHTISQYLQTSCESVIKDTCQELIDIDLEIIKWENEL